MIGSNEDDGLILTTSLTTDPSLYLLYRSVITSWSPGLAPHSPLSPLTGACGPS